MSRFAIVLGLGFLVVGAGGAGGCGGGTADTPPTTPPAGAASSGEGSATAAITVVETSLLSSVLPSGGAGLTLKRQESDAGSMEIDNCTESSGGDEGDGFAVTCSCLVDGEASGTVTTTFDSAKVDGTCSNEDATSGTMISLAAGVRIDFDNCAVHACGERLILDGTVQGTLLYSFNGCTASETLEAALGTESECTGLTVTHEDDSVDTVGFSATEDADGQTGTACINDEPADLEDLADLCEDESDDSCNAATVSCVSDFACQLFADSSTDDQFNTDNVGCVEGCCVIFETGRCSDGEDNDFDGETDCDDSDCAEDPYCVVGPCGSGTVSCNDGFTCQLFADSDPNDAFTTSNVDCINSCCVAAAASETGQCTDETDNDFDGLTDCVDSDCSGDRACIGRLPCETVQNCLPLAAGTTLEEATPSCVHYDVTDWRYQYNDGTCRFDCSVASVPANCLDTCFNLIRQSFENWQSNGGSVAYDNEWCVFYPPPH